ncbi:MAG: hypothetical protein ACYDAG_18840 [Chloroflexota bacterium]
MRGFGMGAGPAGAPLLTLAPVSLPSLVPSLVMVGRVFPKRVLVAIGLAVMATGILSGAVAVGLGL